MTVAELIAILEKIEDKSMNILVVDAVTDINDEVCYYDNVEAFEVDITKTGCIIR